MSLLMFDINNYYINSVNSIRFFRVIGALNCTHDSNQFFNTMFVTILFDETRFVMI